MLNVAYIGPLDAQADLHFRSFEDRADVSIVGQWDAQSSYRPNGYEALLAYTGIDQLLRDSSQIDAVIVAADPWSQVTTIHRAVKAGKHVLCEMPVIPFQVDLQRLYGAFKTAAEHKTVLALALPDRFDPAVLAVQKTVGDFRAHYHGALDLTVQSPVPPIRYRVRDREEASVARECAAYDVALANFVSGELNLGVSFKEQTGTSYLAEADLAGCGRAILSADYRWGERSLRVDFAGSTCRFVLPEPGVEAYTVMHDAWLKAVRGEAPYPVEATEAVTLAAVGVKALEYKNPLSLER